MDQEQLQLDNDNQFLASYLMSINGSQATVDERAPDEVDDFYDVPDEESETEEPVSSIFDDNFQYGVDDNISQEEEEQQDDNSFLLNYLYGDSTTPDLGYDKPSLKGNRFFSEPAIPAGPGNKSVKDAIVNNESAGRYDVVNPGSTATGKYQFIWSIWKNKIGAVTGAKTRKEFLDNPQAQDAFYNWYEKNEMAPAVERLQKYNKQGLTPTQLGRLFHYRGEAGARGYLQGKVPDKPEANNPSISKYLAKYKQAGGAAPLNRQLPRPVIDNLNNRELLNKSLINKAVSDSKDETQKNRVAFKNAKDWTLNYIKSPKYKERLSAFYDNPEQVQTERYNKASGVDQTNNFMENILPQDYVAMYHPILNTILTNKDNMEGELIPYRSRELESLGRQGIYAHELSHSTNSGFGNKQLNTAEKNYIKNRNNLYKNPEISNNPNSIEQHELRPEENKSDIDALRYILKKKGIYDSGTQDFSKEILKKIEDDKEIYQLTPYQNLKSNFKDDDLIDIMNKVAYNDNNSINIAKYGGNIPIAITKEDQYMGLNDDDLQELILPLSGENTIRGLDSGEPVFIKDSVGKKYILRGPKDTVKAKGQVYEKRLRK